MSIKQRHQTTVVLSAALASALVTSGCSSISETLSGDKIDYRTSGTQSVRLDVPPDLSQLPGQTRFGQAPASTVTASSLVRTDKAEAPQSAIAPNKGQGIKLERQGQMRWLSVNQPPEQIWSQVRTFWSEVGFELTTDQPEAGVMETNWSENKAKVPQDGAVRKALGRVFDLLYDTGERDLYRTRIERTATGSEIYISHKGLVEEYEDSKKERTQWRARPSDPNLEAEMLSRLMVKLGASKETAEAVKTADKPAQAAATAPSIARMNADGLSITVDADFDTAWRRVGLALDRSGFTVENRDRKQGAFEVRLSDNDPDASKPGFFARLFGAKAENQDGLSRYKVLVQGQSRTSALVSVLKENGQPTTSNTAKRIAKQLVDELN
ncbi:MAG TPA: outer membrane protein assembly factor BamC [Aquabacterium sp.]|uniref:outer membrane protein assembly factor BamC n=1 Tax=Aquabacterium sp. TaxID=1872578 RepID=UPI002E35BCB5|nr:outer membrane protein assembly factor BamC [Aquabacterium sp.]HEX5356441.1 outer membrane protein assembly factor BamC [Aquabacterium sp.]